MSLRFIIILSALGICSVTAQTEEYIKCNSGLIRSDAQKCLDKYPRLMSISAKTVLNFYAISETACRYETDFIDTIKCMNDAELQCLKDDNIKSLVPSTEMYQKSFKNFCSEKNKFNVSCFTSSRGDIVQCITDKITTPAINASIEDWKTYLCQSQKIGKSCIESSTKLNECPETKKIFLDGEKIQNPAACGGEAGFESGEVNSAPNINKSILLFVTLLFFTIFFSKI